MSDIRFGTDGWRDIIAENFTYENISIVALAISNYLKLKDKGKKGVFIGYDNRFMSDRFALYVAAVMTAKGIKTYLSSSASPTPTTAFMVKDIGLDGSIMITASHNPPIYNGIKFIPEYAGPASKEITDAIEIELEKIGEDEVDSLNIKDLIHDEKLLDKIKHIDDFNNYKQEVISHLDTRMIGETDIKIAVNTMYGAANEILPEILEKNLLKDVLKINNDNDPLFGNKLPDPSEDNLVEFRESVLSNDIDIGIAVDGDGDRFGVIDGNGIFISPNNGISIILDYLISKKLYSKKDKVVRSIATTHLIDEIAREGKLEVIETPVGFKHIGKLMIEGNVLIGGEESGGMSIKGHIPEKDGILATLMLVEIQSQLKKTNKGYLSDYLGELYKRFGRFYSIRLDKKISPDKKGKVIEYFKKTKNRLFDLAVDKRIDIDGIKIMFKDKSWILVRPSGTEPLIRCYLESREESTFIHIKQSLNELIDKENF